MVKTIFLFQCAVRIQILLLFEGGLLEFLVFRESALKTAFSKYTHNQRH